MIKRLRRYRGIRRIMRNRLAMAALSVIIVYLVVAIALLADGPLHAISGGAWRGLVTLEETRERVGPERRPGFLQSPSLEKRVAHLRWQLDRMQRTFDRADAAESPEARERILSELALAERTVADEPFDQLRQRLAEAEEAFTALDDVFLEREDLEVEVQFLTEDLEKLRGSDEPDPEEIAELEGYLEELGPMVTELNDQIPPLLHDAETAIEQILPEPTGWDGFMYDLRLLLGTDSKGASILVKSVYSIKVAFQVGLVASIAAVVFGSILGGLAGYLGGWIDNAVMWVVSTLSSIPYLVLLAVLVFMFRGTVFDRVDKPGLALVPVYAAFGLTFWISVCRVIRGEVMKIRELEYVQAATALGYGRMRVLLQHIMPNTTHLLFINFALLFIGAIKSEVILSFLGLGVKGQPSWGVMISHAKDDVASFFFWEVLSATAFMFGLVLAFNILTDALQDAFDPRHTG